MSQKSRRRNKKILAAIGIGLGAAAMASKKRNASIADNEANESGFAESTKKPSIAVVSGPVKKDTAKPIAKPDTTPKKIVNTSRSRMLRPNPKADGESMGPNETAMFNAKNKMPNTAPPSIDNPYSSRVIKGRFGNSKKDGGRMGLKSGGKVKKSMGKALRGGGKVMR
jgi:hypothetical protein